MEMVRYAVTQRGWKKCAVEFSALHRWPALSTSSRVVVGVHAYMEQRKPPVDRVHVHVHRQFSSAFVTKSIPPHTRYYNFCFLGLVQSLHPKCTASVLTSPARVVVT